METRQAADLYLEDAVETAPPAKLVRMLLEGAVRFIDRATVCAPTKNDRRGFVESLSRASNIVTELRLALVPMPGSDIAPNLDSLYQFCEDRIGTALSEDRIEPAQEARGILVTLLDAWKRIEIEA
jgi:flagellar protein FliS